MMVDSKALLTGAVPLALLLTLALGQISCSAPRPEVAEVADTTPGVVTGLLVSTSSGSPVNVGLNLFRDSEEGDVQEVIQERMNKIELSFDSVGAFRFEGVPPGKYHLFTMEHGIIGEGFSVVGGQLVELGRVGIGE